MSNSEDNVPNVRSLLGRFENASNAQKPQPIPQEKTKTPPTAKGPPFSLHIKSIKAPPATNKANSSNCDRAKTPLVLPRPQIGKNPKTGASKFQQELENKLKTPKPTPASKVTPANYRPPLPTPNKGPSVPSPPEKSKKPWTTPTPKSPVHKESATGRGPGAGQRSMDSTIPPALPARDIPVAGLGPRDDSIPSVPAPAAPYPADIEPMIITYRGKRLPDTVVINGDLYRLSPVGPPKGPQPLRPHTPDRPCDVFLSPEVIARAKSEIEDDTGYDNSTGDENERIPETTEDEELAIERSHQQGLAGLGRPHLPLPVHPKVHAESNDDELYDDTCEVDDDYEDMTAFARQMRPWLRT